MPSDICAFWWQTNTLSRQGLMLVNMSMVEPGYQGRLACLFANFGKQPVSITPDTNVAKLVFFELDAAALAPFGKPTGTPQYDRDLVAAAMNAPRTFLDVETIATSIAAQRDAALAQVQQALQKAATAVDEQTAEKSKELHEVAADARKAAADGILTDTNKTVRKAFAAAVLGFALLVAATTFVPWLQSQFQPSVSSQVKDQIDTALNDRLSLAVSPNDIASLRTQVTQLQQQLAALKSAAAKPSG